MSIGSPRRLCARASALRRYRAAGCAAIACLVSFAALAQVNPLPPDRAFRFSARMIDARTVEARFAIADG